MMKQTKNQLYLVLNLLTFGDFFGVKFETGIKSKWVGRFKVGSGVTGIGSEKKKK